MHVEPGACFVGGGLWHPGGEALARLRASIDERPRRWRRVLTEPAFRGTFLSGASAALAAKPKLKPKSKAKAKAKDGDVGGGGDEDETAAVLREFARTNAEGALKTKPKVSMEWAIPLRRALSSGGCSY